VFCLLSKEKHLRREHRRSQGGQRGHGPQKKFLENIVILCFEKRFSKQNSVVPPKSNILDLQNFLPSQIFVLATPLLVRRNKQFALSLQKCVPFFPYPANLCTTDAASDIFIHCGVCDANPSRHDFIMWKAYSLIAFSGRRHHRSQKGEIFPKTYKTPAKITVAGTAELRCSAIKSRFPTL